MFETSATTAKLEEALAKAQASFHAAAKDATNPHFGSKYADLASIMEACRAALTSNGIAVTQWPVHRDDQRLGIITRLAMGGEWMQSTWSIPVSKGDAQGYGSAVTYARRYALAAAVGVVADEDDDGNAASEKPKQEAKKAPTATSSRTTSTKPGPDTSAMTPEQREGWEMEIQLAASIGLDELRKLSDDMSTRLTAGQKEVLRPAFKAAERAAKDAYAKSLAKDASNGTGASP